MTDEISILRRADIEEAEGLSKTHFLNPNARRTNKSLGDMAGLTGFGFHVIEVEPGCDTTEHHLHHHEDECVFVLEGEATAMLGDEEHTVGPGDFIGYRRGRLAHSIRNTGKGAFRCIVVGERRSHDVCDYPRLGKRLYRNAGMPWDIVDLDALANPSDAGKK
ncbi:MAG: cupin domain-containing protein [Crocosphaera sp.]|nr:cupin domain-containing protein [Crocosphaera sp.]MDJ0686798.1 cupin domain-containing protein [Alphaproteobacteria bacterium]